MATSSATCVVTFFKHDAVRLEHRYQHLLDRGARSPGDEDVIVRFFPGATACSRERARSAGVKVVAGPKGRAGRNTAARRGSRSPQFPDHAYSLISRRGSSAKARSCSPTGTDPVTLLRVDSGHSIRAKVRLGPCHGNRYRARATDRLP
jgi:hypothetical protein